MNNNRRRNPFWRVAGPLFGYWGIEMTVQFILEFLLLIPYMGKAYGQIAGSTQTLSYEELMNQYYQILSPAFNEILSYQVQITGISALFTLILTVILFRKDRKEEQLMGAAVREKVPVSQYWMVLIMGLVGSIAVTCLSAMAQVAFASAEYQQTAESMYSATVLVELLVFGIISPLAEEMMFRGVMYRRYRETKSFYYGAVWSSVFFALLHTNTVQMIYTFLLGIFLCYVYEKFASIKAPILLHMILNIGSVVFTEIGVFHWLGEAWLRMALAVIGAAFVCSVAFVCIQKVSGPVQIMQKPSSEDNGNDSNPFGM